MKILKLKINSFSYFTISIFIEVLLFISGVYSNRCTSKLTCGECIREGPPCTWCLMEDITENDTPLCDHKENLGNKGCKRIIDPKNTLEIIKDKPLSNKGKIQIKPQEIRIKLRPNFDQTFQIEFRQAGDYPVDLYYLMDLSNTMRDDKEKLGKLGKQLTEKMSGITKNFTLGFGTFVDKVVAPFTDTHEEKLRNPCVGTKSGGTCDPPFGFKNNMPLSLKTSEFAKEVDKAKISGNLDGPEGGLDAIMQVIVCKKQIGWRDKSRKIIVYSSDADYHFAGDGKLGGLVEPNDVTCHLDDRGTYYRSTELDYPSISQIKRQSLKHKINILFAVTEDQTERYSELSKRLTQSVTGKLDKDSGNVVDLIQEQYDKITSEVEMKDDINDAGIQLSYKTKCPGTGLDSTNVCKEINMTTKVTFELKLRYAFCPSDPNKYNRTFNVFAAGLPDVLKVHLEMLCECDCEVEEANSTKCSHGNGTFQCGICRCNEDRSGKKCECDTNYVHTEDKDAGCRNGNDTRLCSGLGTCDCGQCTCRTRPNPEERYYGKFCECNNFGCNKKDGKICSGPDHGKCDCGVCKCDLKWKGDDCSCTTSEDNCKDEHGTICSERGYCHCGSCVCNGTETDDEKYFGAVCDDCATCPGKCHELRECVECSLQDQHSANLTCPSCANKEVSFEDNIEVHENEKQCIFEGDEQCRYAFKYSSDEKNRLIVKIRRSKDCPQPLPVVQIASGVVGGVVATGLFLLMLWKLLTSIHDRREFAKFNKERLKAKWNQGDNPLYVGAVQTFDNPSYSGKVN